MKEKIIKIISYGMDGISPETAELKAKELIILFNQHMLDKAKESHSISEMIEKTFINI